MKRTFILSFVLLICGQAVSQKYFTRDGTIVFESDAPVEKIEAVNNKVMCVWDTESGMVEMAVLVKSFKFEKALMEEHFNENYLESEKFPKAKFKGRVENMSSINLKEDGSYIAEVVGELSMHGVTKSINMNANISVKNGDVKCIANFEIAVADYDIKIPKIVRENIAKTVQILMDIDLKLLEK